MHKILTNEAYCGTLVWGCRSGHPAIHRGDPPVRVENAWPAIVSKAMYDSVRHKMAARKPVDVYPRTVPSPYLPSGLLCFSCGRAMNGHSARSGRNFYYLCNRKSKQGKEGCSAPDTRTEVTAG